jgi:hypothetical protein
MPNGNKSALNPQLIGNAEKNAAAWRLRNRFGERLVAGRLCYLAFVGVVSGVWVFPDSGITVPGRLVAGMSGL